MAPPAPRNGSGAKIGARPGISRGLEGYFRILARVWMTRGRANRPAKSAASIVVRPHALRIAFAMRALYPPSNKSGIKACQEHGLFRRFQLFISDQAVADTRLGEEVPRSHRVVLNVEVPE